MVAPHCLVFRHPSVVAAAGAILAAVSLLPLPAHGFAIKTTGWEEVEDAAREREAAAAEGLRARPGSIPQRRLERGSDRVAGGATDKIERDTLAAGKKEWDRLERTRKFVRIAETIAKRYGSAVERGLRFSGPDGGVVGTRDALHTIGDRVFASTIAIPLIDRYFDNQWNEREAQFRLDVSRIPTLGQRTRRHDEAVSNMPTAGLAMRPREKGKERATASTNDEVSVRPWGSIGGRSERKDSWAPDAPGLRAEGSSAAAAISRTYPAGDDREDNASYEAALKALQGGGGSNDFEDLDDGAVADSPASTGESPSRWTAAAGAIRTFTASSRAEGDTNDTAELREVDASDGAAQDVPPEDYTTTLAALERLEADRRAEEAAQEAKRRAAQARREMEAKRARERAARQRAEEARQRAEEARQRAARQAREVSRSYSASSLPSYSDSARPSGGSRSTGLFGSGSSRSGGLFSAQSGRQALRDIEARRRAQERQRAERLRRQQEDYLRQQEEARRQQEMQRQRREAAERRQRQAEARKRQEELRRRQEEARRQREAREREIAEARKRQMALRQQQIEAKRRQEEQRRRQEKARRRAAANAATAAHCLQSRRLKGGFNVADVQIRNTCGFSINVKGACMGTSFKANYPHKGTYSPYESMGLYTLHPGRWRPAVSEDMCNKKGRTARNIACRKPFTPHFTSPSGSSYACFE